MSKRRRVLVVCPYPKDMAPSQRLKYEQYFYYLTEQGYDFDIRPFVSLKFSKVVNRRGTYLKKFYFLVLAYLNRICDLFKIRNYDLIYIHLWVTPIGFPFFEYLFCLFAKKILYDIDDLIFLKDTKNTNNSIVNLVKGRKKPILLMKMANHVITCTPYLDLFVRKYNINTTDISSTINTKLYTPKSEYHLANEEFVIGWSGSHSTSKYVHLLTNVFISLNELGIKYKLIVMGDPFFQIHGVNIEAISWTKEREVDVIRSFDVGLYPLPDSKWVLGKSSLKAIQYMALGVPTVATAIGTNFRVIENGKNGFLVNSDQEWVDAIVKLMNDEKLRKEVGQEGVKKVEKEYSINANKAVYLRILNNVCESK